MGTEVLRQSCHSQCKNYASRKDLPSWWCYSKFVNALKIISIVLIFLAENSLACCILESKRAGKDQELIQSSTTPDPGHHMG